MTVLILVVAVTILVSLNCSLYEAVLYSTRMGTLEAAKNDKRRRRQALKMIRLKNDISAPLSAILILNTVANTAGASLAGMYAAKALGEEHIHLFTIVFTLGILLFSEIIPKTVGAVYWRSFWPLVIYPITAMKWILFPAILLTQKLVRLMTPQQDSTSHVTEEDILGTIRLGARGGEITQVESSMLHHIIDLETKSVEEIMTPRTVMFVLNAEMTAAEAADQAGEKGFTRIPVYQGDRENIVGYVVIHELNTASDERPEARIKELATPIMFVRETQNCLVMLTEFLQKRLHIAMVDDEYGGVAGLVTLEDLIETALGTEIVDENDPAVDMQKMAKKRVKQRSYLKEEDGMHAETGPMFAEPAAMRVSEDAGETNGTDRETGASSG